jgi:hypothetical protein
VVRELSKAMAVFIKFHFAVVAHFVSHAQAWARAMPL